MDVSQSLLEIVEDLSDSDERKIELYKLIKNRKKKQCGICENLVFNLKSCEFCIRKYLEDNYGKWSSGNEKINELIQTCQKDTIRSDAIIEWIPFEHLKDIQYMTEGNLFKIHNAMWTKGRYMSWDPERQKLKRFGSHSVTIKHISVNPDPDQWFQEIKTHLSLSASISPIILSYGLTRDPEGYNSYMIVMESVKNTLKSYLQDTNIIRRELTWIQKYRILHDISLSLESIHEKQLVHRGLNPGNIMYSNRVERWLIGDFGLCSPVDFLLNEVQGIIPYAAPEILKIRMDETKQTSLDITSDIYSFGMIMWEISTTHQPFKGQHYGNDFITKIINNERPEVMPGTPSKYSELMKSCWSPDVLERPSIRKIQDEIKNVLSDFDKGSMPQEELDLMNKVHFLEKRVGFLSFRDDYDYDVKPNPGTIDPDAQSIEIIPPDRIRNEEISDGIGLISYANLSSPKEIRQVAIKSLKIDNITKDKGEFYLNSLQQRIHDMGVFSHPNIVEFLGLGIKDEDKLFFVMPRANGGNLRNYYNENKPLPFDSKIEIAKGIASGIMKLHDNNIVHENLNPENILMFNETPKISNLPLPYKNVEFYFKNKEYYFDNSLFSVIGYVDPNFFPTNKGFKKNKSVDIYSFGSLLWEILSERVPYSEESDLLQLVRNIKDNDYREVEIPDIPDKIKYLIKKCWENDGSARGTIYDVYQQL